MNLVNTDGLVLLGPGSEWLWTAVSGIVLAGTFIALYRQLRLQRVQMRENTKVLRSQAHYNALLLGTRPLEILIQDRVLADIVSIGYSTPDALSEADWFRCGNFIFLQVNAWEYFYYQSRDGSIPKELWVGADAYFRGLVATRPGFARFWSEYRELYDEPFHAHVEAEFAKKPAVEAEGPHAD